MTEQEAIDDLMNNRAVNFLTGQVMKLSKGRANPVVAKRLIIERILFDAWKEKNGL